MSDVAEPFAYKPLYVQVKDRLRQRLIDGTWLPGQMIPSEMDLAREIGVSQGTVRKALDAIAAEGLLVRHQGRGTYVCEPEESRILFRYFRMQTTEGDRVFPESNCIGWTRHKASPSERTALELAASAAVWRIRRVRSVSGMPLMAETIVLSDKRFTGFGELSSIPNNVYRLYSEQWGITIARASERLTAIAATEEDGQALNCASGTPLLRIERTAFDLENRPVELRISRSLTSNAYYLSDLR